MVMNLFPPLLETNLGVPSVSTFCLTLQEAMCKIVLNSVVVWQIKIWGAQLHLIFRQTMNNFFSVCPKKHYLCIYLIQIPSGCPVFYQVTYFKGISLQITGTGLFHGALNKPPGDAVRDPVLLVSKQHILEDTGTQRFVESTSSWQEKHSI